MGKVITVFCDKGGVGKTTITLMLAHGLTALHNKSVLVLDLDETPRVSEALMGRVNFIDNVAEDARISGLIRRLIFSQAVDPHYYIRAHQGGLKATNGKFATLGLIPGDKRLSKSQDLAIGDLMLGNRVAAVSQAHKLVSDGAKTAVSLVAKDFDFVLIDAPPRMTHYSRGAVDASDLVLVPYVPGKGAHVILVESAINIERLDSGDELKKRPFEVRKYVALPNKVKKVAAYGHAASIEDLIGEHPHLNFEVPEQPEFEKLIEFPEHLPLTLKDIYGNKSKVVKDLGTAVTGFLHQKLSREATS